jgi:hypothetical protein
LASEGLFSRVFSRGDAAAAVADEAWLRAMLDVPAANAAFAIAKPIVEEAQ